MTRRAQFPEFEEHEMQDKQQSLFEEKCAERAAALGLEDVGNFGEVKAAKEVLSELANLGITRRLYQARGEIARHVRARYDG